MHINWDCVAVATIAEVLIDCFWLKRTIFMKEIGYCYWFYSEKVARFVSVDRLAV